MRIRCRRYIIRCVIPSDTEFKYEVIVDNVQPVTNITENNGSITWGYTPTNGNGSTVEV